MTAARRRLGALGGALLAALLVLGVLAPAASAHAALLSTTPADGEITAGIPTEVVLRFGEQVGTGLGALRVLAADGARVDTGVVTQTDHGTAVHLALRPDLPQGSYVTVWRVVSADSHPVSGAFSFSVGRPSRAASQLLGRGNLTRLTAAPRAPSIALGTTRFLGFCALLLLLGAAVFTLLLWPAGLARLRPLLLAAAGVEAVMAALALGLQGPYAAGLGLSHSADPALLRQVLGQQYGLATTVRIALALACAGVLLAVRPGSGRRWSGVLVALGTATAATWTAAGHGGSGRWQPLAAVLDVVHLVSVSAWVGGLLVLGIGIRRAFDSQLSRTVLPGWSRLARASVALLVATGVFASVRQVGDLSALTTTRYGALLLVKDALVALMLLFALVGHSWVRTHYGPARPDEPGDLEPGDLERAELAPAPAELAVVGAPARTPRPAPGPPQPDPTPQDLAGLRRSTAVESVLSLAVVAVTALLVNSVPAREAFAPPYTGTSAAGPLTVAVDVYPARQGLNGLHIYTVGSNGLTRDVAQVSGDVVRAGTGDTITIHPVHKSLGHYEDLGLVLPATGTWTVELQVRLDDVTSYPTMQTFTVK